MCNLVTPAFKLLCRNLVKQAFKLLPKNVIIFTYVTESETKNYLLQN